MASWVQKLKGNLFLAYRAVWAHPFRIFIGSDDRTGKERFLANYAGEGNIVTAGEEREWLAQAGRCINCGLCEAAAALRAWPSAMAISHSRATPQLPHAKALLEKLRPEILAEAEALCPTRVPLSGLAAFLSRRLKQVEEAR
jgi:hypothetical protein